MFTARDAGERGGANHVPPRSSASSAVNLIPALALFPDLDRVPNLNLHLNPALFCGLRISDNTKE